MHQPVVPFALIAALALLVSGPILDGQQHTSGGQASSSAGVLEQGASAVRTVEGVSAGAPADPVTVNQMAVAVSSAGATGTGTPSATPSPSVSPTASPTASPSGAPSAASPDAPPVAPSAPVVAAAKDPSGVVETAPIDTTSIQTVGITWPAGQDVATLQPQIRTKVGDTWSSWQPVPQPDSAPDPGSAEAARGRSGTDSVWIGSVDAVQVGFAAKSTAAMTDVKVALVGSKAATTQAQPAVWRPSSTVSRAASARPAAALATSAVAAPTIITRDQWGAAPEACTPAVASTLVGAVIHHTADTNSYTTVAQAEQMIRNDQAYHINVRGWCDLGYNFVVDKWGNIYEGRANSETEPVIGVHAGGFNTGTLGVAILGDYTSLVPSAATQEALAELIGWRLAAYGRNPGGMMTYTTYGGETSRWPTTTTGTTVTEPVVMGHRDVDYTSCPGDGAYSTLAWIRDRASKIAFSEPLVQALYSDMLQRPVDPTGLSTWTAALMAGTGASALGDQIAHSAEYVNRRVVEAYAQILGRTPDPTGLATWSQAIMSGRLRVEDLRGQLIQSDEYYARAGGTDPAYVARLYQDILGRAPAASEVSSWVSQIPSRGRGIVSNGVWRSLESAQRRVNEAFGIYLGRSADPTGLSTWAPYWQANGEDALRAMIIGSDEYLARAVSRFP